MGNSRWCSASGNALIRWRRTSLPLKRQSRVHFGQNSLSRKWPVDTLSLPISPSANGNTLEGSSRAAGYFWWPFYAGMTCTLQFAVEPPQREETPVTGWTWMRNLCPALCPLFMQSLQDDISLPLPWGCTYLPYPAIYLAMFESIPTLGWGGDI